MSANIMPLPRALAAEKARIDALGGAEAFPYDPLQHVSLAVGLDKLRAVADRKLAADLYELYWLAEANTRDPRKIREYEQANEAKQKQERDHIATVCEQALTGKLGSDAQAEAREVLVDRYGKARTDEASMRECARRIRALRR